MLMASFWEGMLAGYGIAIPVGAIAVLIVDVSLRRGFGAGFMAGAGAASADLLYATLAALAGEALAGLVGPYAAQLRLVSALVLFALGGLGLWRLRSTGQGDERPAAQSGGFMRIYAQFLGMTLVNPLTVVYFAALIVGREGSTFTAAGRLLFVLGAALASLSWQTLLAGVGAIANQRLSPRFQRLTSLVGNLVVIGLGVRVLIGVF